MQSERRGGHNERQAIKRKWASQWHLCPLVKRPGASCFVSPFLIHFLLKWQPLKARNDLLELKRAPSLKGCDHLAFQDALTSLWEDSGNSVGISM